MLKKRRQTISCLGITGLAPALMLASNEPMKFVFSRPVTSARTQWLIRVYSDVAFELGRKFRYVDVPPARATQMVLKGEVDGELGRTFAYLSLYPSLLRVNEPNNTVRFACYKSRRSEKYAFDWGLVRQRGLRCEYRRGIPEVDLLLRRHVDQNSISCIGAIEQGLNKLLLNRTDLYFDVEEAVEDFRLDRQLALSDPMAFSGIERLSTVTHTTGHAYLNAKNRDYVQEFARLLQKMKRSGMLQHYLQEALATARKQRLGRAGH